MKKSLLILFGGFFLALSAYAVVYLGRVKTPAVPVERSPELAWLKMEFALNDAEYERIRRLHEGYLPDCARMCEKIASLNNELRQMVLATNTVTPAISEKLQEIGNVRQECQTRMLSHFYAVSRAMPEEQGRRYLASMQELTSLSSFRQHPASDLAQDHAHHSAEHGH